MTNDVVWTLPTYRTHAARPARPRRAVRRAAAGELVRAAAARRVDDAVTGRGRALESTCAAFVASDATTPSRHLPPHRAETTIVSWSTKPRSSFGSRHRFERRRRARHRPGRRSMQAAYRATTRRVAASVGCRHLDLYEAWSDAGAPGWDAADQAGLMLDRIHATARRPPRHRRPGARPAGATLDPRPLRSEVEPTPSRRPDDLPRLPRAARSWPPRRNRELLVPVTLSWRPPSP